MQQIRDPDSKLDEFDYCIFDRTDDELPWTIRQPEGLDLYQARSPEAIVVARGAVEQAGGSQVLAGNLKPQFVGKDFIWQYPNAAKYENEQFL